MTGSWTMDAFIIGCILLLVIPTGVWFYEEIFKKKRGEAK